MNKRLLIVDDEPEIVIILKQRAEFYHLDCDVETTGEECVAKAILFKPDLIVLDMNLPKISGLGLLRELKNDEELAKIPVVVLSATSQDDVVHEAMDLGASAYFSKAASMDELFTTIQEYLH